ncbi:hypothetical protein [Streptomyces sp. NRRL S-87]|uniref:hypothetical protein n=1 Tax=Streptomyces sp. NRRL S-87 TaxID=1463920 RepID=UPI0005651625|nr:hypothetical protein [Streptomyces sp. NRRL S-87]
MFAVVCVLLATTGHVLMSGRDVPWWAALAALAATATAAWATADRERGLLAVTTATVAVQAVLHTGFTLAQSLLTPPVVSRPVPGTGPAGEHAHDAMRSVHGMHMHAMHTHATHMGGMLTGGGTSTGGIPVGAPGGDGMHDVAGAASSAASSAADTVMSSAGHDMAGTSSFGMLAAHLLAAVLCGLWLAYAERAAFRLLRAVAGWLRAPLFLLFGLFTPIPPRPRPRVRRTRDRQVLRRLLLVHAITSRGPPTGTAVL